MWHLKFLNIQIQKIYLLQKPPPLNKHQQLMQIITKTILVLLEQYLFLIHRRHTFELSFISNLKEYYLHNYFPMQDLLSNLICNTINIMKITIKLIIYL